MLVSHIPDSVEHGFDMKPLGMCDVETIFLFNKCHNILQSARCLSKQRIIENWGFISVSGVRKLVNHNSEIKALSIFNAARMRKEP